ncbi:MAG: helix-turn-helix domain-containing protein [Verrucomicrobiae bacterium]|nr:helix-turn-helix domain-containing protein [Verrucomicrobiae bacterium]
MISSPALVVTELIGFQHANVPRGRQSWPMHLHHFFQLDVLLAGQLTVRVEREHPWRARPGDGWLIPPLVRHGFEQETAFRQASFKLRLAPAYWPKAGMRWRRVRFPRHLRQMLDAAREGPTENARATAMAALCVLETIGHDRRPADPSLDAFRQALWPLLERIESEPYAGWSVARMASACHVSADHFSRCFRKLLGQPPHRYLLETRIRAAAASLLNEPARPIKEIADAAGYATIHAFSAAFKNTLGRSPAAYRRTQTEM